ncbi:exosome complex component RRP46 isoform X1 [Phyllobates terribilis]|uniref:exosome complex component RRP46 isoform X1 n=1 Tax=Phyllobates terribilis TaxID=111132 RepID=UPI003CCB2180
MPNRSTVVNVRRLYLNLQLQADNPGRRVIASLDAQKALDSVQWEYLWGVMQKFGFGPRFIEWVQLLYSQPTAKIRVNGAISPSFHLGRGTRQGYPLSLLLFAIAIEPLAAVIRETREVQGFKYGRLEEKIALYADDLLLFLGDPSESLSCAMQIIERFGAISGLKINWSKSVLFKVDRDVEWTDREKEENKLQCKEVFKYLGIQVSLSVSDYLNINLAPLLKKLKAKIDIWTKLHITVVGRINLFKMILMPKLLYVLHNAPMWISKKRFKSLNVMIRALVWGKKQARIRLEILQRPKDEGGLALPNPEMYFLAAQSQHFRGWSFSGSGGSIKRILEHSMEKRPLLEGGDMGRLGGGKCLQWISYIKPGTH